MSRALIVFVAFVATRIVILELFVPHSSDLRYLAQYPLQLREAVKAGVPFREKFSEAMQREGNGPEFSRPEMRYPAYPPLSVLAMSWMIFTFPDDEILGGPTVGAFKAWKEAIRFQLFCFDIVCFLVLWRLAGVLKASRSNTTVALVFYTIVGIISCEVLYDRIDMLVAPVLAAMVYALALQKNLAATILLAVAVHMRIIPVVCTPFLIAYLASRDAVSLKNLVSRLLIQTLIFSSAVLGIGGVMIAVFGESTFEFLKFHSQRGIHIESLYGGMALIVRHLMSIPMLIENSFGSINIETTADPFLKFMSVVLQMVTVGVVTVLGLFHWKESKTDRHHGNQGKQADFDILLSGILICILGGILFSKVLSPQFFIMTNIFLAAYAITTCHKNVLRIMLIVSILTAAIFPLLYESEIIGAFKFNDKYLYNGPTLFGIVLLNSRNFLALTAFALIFRRFLKKTWVRGVTI